MQIECPRCGCKYEVSARVCPRCGNVLPMTYVRKCGSAGEKPNHSSVMPLWSWVAMWLCLAVAILLFSFHTVPSLVRGSRENLQSVASPESTSSVEPEETASVQSEKPEPEPKPTETVPAKQIATPETVQAKQNTMGSEETSDAASKLIPAAPNMPKPKVSGKYKDL